MKIAWLQDLNPLAEISGGAQLTDRTHIMAGFRLGHDVVPVTPSESGLLKRPYDAFILSNVTSFRMDTFQEMIKQGAPFVIFAHDYTCKWRLFYPMQPKCKSCYLRDRWLPVLQASRLIVWLSPLHRWAWLYMYPELKKHPYVLVPSPVSPDEFYAKNGERKGVIAVNAALAFKGRDNFINWAKEHPDIAITHVGQEDATLPSNITCVGVKTPFEMNDLYNKHETLVHLPNTPQPCERVVLEAYLAGCKIIGNRLIGALSYRWFKSRDLVARHVREAPKRFWDAVEKAVGGRD